MAYPRPLQISRPLDQQDFSNPQAPSYGRKFPYETDVFRNEKPPSFEKSDGRQQFQSVQRAENTVTISAELFERMFNESQKGAASGGGGGDWRKGFGNPTALGIVGFLLALSPLSSALMGWRGAGGNGAATIGPIFFMGGLLMLLGGFMEWVMGNTFPFVVFASYGGFWFSYGATLLPFFNAFGAFSPDASSPAAGLSTPGFNASFGFFTVFMALLSFIFLVCSLRTNAVFVVIFAGLFGGFTLLTATFWAAATGDSATAGRMLFMAGLVTFVSDVAGWYLLFVLMLGSVKFPLSLPVGDLSAVIPAAQD